eukprot:TRINITY_DN66631_c0_g1_i1.p2 TRINITY_DN66631_c0_g1~~TRINITY_DN66631_c0_g1_i1.p2  ORF type:complete len:164 (+),score=36.82 TRINITY_DN66631_c0_g1_i1:120-611(+)
MSDETNVAMEALRALVMRADSRWTDTGIPRVQMVRAEACASQVYQPMLHWVLQGSKALSIGDQLLEYPSGSYFLVPVDIPATGEIRPSGQGLPYLAVSLSLAPDVIAGLLVEASALREQSDTRCFSAVTAPPELIDAWLRLMKLMDRPDEVVVLAPMIEREIL